MIAKIRSNASRKGGVMVDEIRNIKYPPKLIFHSDDSTLSITKVIRILPRFSKLSIAKGNVYFI